MLRLMVLLPPGSSNLETGGQAGQRECSVCCCDQCADVITCVQINEIITCADGAYTQLVSANSWMQSSWLVGRKVIKNKKHRLSLPLLIHPFFSLLLVSWLTLLYSSPSTRTMAIVIMFLLALQVPINSF